MTKTIQLTLLGLALAASSFAQQLDPARDPLRTRYEFNSTTAGAAKVTVQASATSGGVNFEQVDVTCAAIQTVTFYENGTAATTTAGTATGPIGPSSAVPPSVFTASNVGTGTTLKSFTVSAAITSNFDLSAFSLAAQGGGAQNFSVGVNGACTIQIVWRQTS
jgi:hypothetical protein